MNTSQSLQTTNEQLDSLLKKKFVNCLFKIEKRHQNIVKELAEIAFQSTQNGQVCFDLNQKYQFQNKEIADQVLLQKIIAESDVLGTQDDYCPLIIENQKLYLQKYYQYQKKIINFILNRIQIDQNNPSFDQNNQFDQSFYIIHGGPGTGKTTKAIECLKKVQTRFMNEFRFCITAPTGKACARLKEVLIKQDHSLLSQQAGQISSIMTIHKMLEIQYPIAYSKYNQENQLPYDLIIIDEASMIDIRLMSQIFEAISDQTTLIILGDFFQLASIEAGSVLKDITESLSEKTNHVISLTQNHRFRTDSSINQLSQIIKRGDEENLLHFINSKHQDVEIKTFSNHQHKINFLHEKLFNQLDQLTQIQSPQDAFALLQKNMILTALRKGQDGCQNLNQYFETQIKIKNAIPLNQKWFHGRIIILNHNLPQYNLQNGDVGITFEIEAKKNQFEVYFQTNDDYFCISTTLLSHYESAYAITIHKSQGSEFNAVYIDLPEHMYPILTKELLYTALTRAKEKVYLLCQIDIIKQVLKNETKRMSDIHFFLHQN